MRGNRLSKAKNDTLVVEVELSGDAIPILM
jgi:hypothetical protein